MTIRKLKIVRQWFGPSTPISPRPGVRVITGMLTGTSAAATNELTPTPSRPRSRRQR